MKWFLYNCLFGIAYVAMLPKFLTRMARRGGYRDRFSDRFGKYPEGIFAGMERPIWIHAVSVGEVSVAGQLMREMRAQDPSVRFVFSTTSSTGWKQAEKQVTDRDVLIYNPLDFPKCVKRAFNAVKPRAIILTESEIWPNFIRTAVKRSVPVYLVNARVSDRSAPRYVRLRWFFGEIFAAFTRIYAQSDLDAKRLTDAGARPEAVVVTGSFKFDVAKRNPAKERELADWILRHEGGDKLPPILLGGSTWPGEDAILAGKAYPLVREACPEALLVIAPRHFEKADEVEANIIAAGWSCVRRGRELKGGEAVKGEGRKVYLADTTGELMGLYGISSVAFVGKSMWELGGQNMIEPCACGVATLVGPHTENFRPVMSDLLSADAIIQCGDEHALCEVEIPRLFREPVSREALGKRAEEAVKRRLGVVGRVAAELVKA